MKFEMLQNDCFYHIYNRGINRCNIFKSDENKQYFLNKLKEHLHDVITVYAYCLMDNHFHLIVQVLNEKEVTQKFSNFFNAYAKAFNKQEKRTGSLFEKHFKRIKLADQSYLRNLIVYVHQNPKSHLTIDFENYKFSSYSSLLSNKPTNLPREQIIELFFNLENLIKVHQSKSDNLTDNYTLE